MSDQILNAALESLIGGTSGQIVVCQGDGALVSTSALKTVGGTSLLGSGNIAVGSGDAVGPSSSTDNAVARFDATTGKLLQNCVVTIGDTGNIAGVGTVSCGAITTSGQIIGTESRLNLSSGVGGQLAGYISTTPLFSASTSGGFRLQNTVSFGFANVAGGIDNAADVKWSRGSTGPTFDVCAAGGIRSRNLANSADAALTCEAITASGLMCCGVYTFATVPSASSNTGKFLRISDRAQKHAYSDGTNWRFFGDDVIIS